MSFSAALRASARPVEVPPVKLTLAMSGCSTRRLPISRPAPGRTEKRPFGVDDPRELEADERRPGRGLQEHRVAGGERRRHLLRVRGDRRVPGGDGGDEPERLVHREGEGVAALGGERLVGGLEGGRDIAEGAGGGGGERPGLLQRLAGVEGLDAGDAVGVRLDAVGDPGEEAGALVRPEVPPGRVRLRRLGALDGAEAVGLGGALQHAVDRAVGREDRGDLRARAGRPFARDVELAVRQVSHGFSPHGSLPQMAPGQIATGPRRFRISRSTL